MDEDFEFINPPPDVVPLETVDGLVTVDYTNYEPLEFKQLPQGPSAKLDKLQVFKLFSNYLSAVPECYRNLTSLQQFFLCCNSSKPGSGLPSLPSYIGQLSHLRLLNLVGNQFLSFPDCLCSLDGLTTLYMNNCNLTRIPEEICNMKSLLEVDLSDNDFSCQGSLPKGLFLLPQLKDLYLAKCRLQSLPPEIGNLKNLEGIRLGKNELSELPDEFYNLKKLKKLYAEKNKLRGLSPKVAQLKCLQFLLLMENELTQLPDEISQLKELVHLNLFDNRLTCIPRGITEMEKLSRIQLDQNNYLQQPPLDVCLRGLEQIKGYFDSFAAPLLNPIHSRRLKIVLLGESEAGKSCLTYAFINAAAKPPSSPTDDESTVGVEIYSWRPSPDGIEFKIIDCAGQRRYQLTHPFFLSEEALHLVVVNLYKYEKTDASFKENVGDWLDMVSYRISKPRIMIVPTHLDMFLSSEKKCVIDKCNHILELVKNYQERQAQVLKYEITEIRKRDDYQRRRDQLDKLTWQQEHRPVISSVLKYCDVKNAVPAGESYIAMVPVSNKKELVGIIQLRDEINRAAQDPKLFPSVGRDLPPSWVELEKAFKKHREAGKPHFMAYEDFEAFALEHSGLQGPTLGSAVQYYDTIGELKHYKGIPSLHINVFLDLEWLVKLIKLVFRHDHKTALCYKVEYLGLDGLDEQEFEELTENLEYDALLSIKLLRCIWMEMNLGENLFNGMVNLLQHFGLACKVPGKTQILVPWFLEKVPEMPCWPDDPPSEHVEVKLMISTLRYLPPALFDRLRVKVCIIAQEQRNWDKGMLLRVNTIMVRVQCVELQQSPAITLSGRGPKEDLNKLWEVLLRIVQEAHDLLKEWERLTVRNYSLCPACGHCRFKCNWLSVDQPDFKELKRKVQRCRKNRHSIMSGDGIDKNLICPPEDAVDGVLNSLPDRHATGEVSDLLFVNLAPDMADCWNLVAIRLGFNQTAVDRISADVGKVTDRAMEMLSLWHKMNTHGATKSKLMKAFQEVKREDLVVKVRNFRDL